MDALGRQAEEFGGDYVVLAQGSVSELTEQIEAWREAGGTHASVVTMGLGFRGVDDHIDYLASVANALRLSLRPYRASPRARPGRVIHITTFTFVQVAAAIPSASRRNARPPQVTGMSEPAVVICCALPTVLHRQGQRGCYWPVAGAWKRASNECRCIHTDRAKRRQRCFRPRPSVVLSGA